MKITKESTVVNKFPHSEDGMTIRQFYAGLAMQGVLITHGEDLDGVIASRAVKYADALIEELNKTEG